MSQLSFPITNFLSESIQRLADAEADAAAEAAALVEAVEEALADTSHTDLQDIGTLTHAAIDTYFDQIANVDIDIGTETIDSFMNTEGDAAFWTYVVTKAGTEIRAGIIIAAWDNVADSTPVFQDGVSTEDIGDTSGVAFTVDKTGNTVRLRATVTSNNWAIRVRRLLVG